MKTFFLKVFVNLHKANTPELIEDVVLQFRDMGMDVRCSYDLTSPSNPSYRVFEGFGPSLVGQMIDMLGDVAQVLIIELPPDYVVPEYLS